MKPELVLPPDVDERLLAEREAASDRLRDLIHARGEGEFTSDAERHVFRMVRRIASIDAARHGRDFSALTIEELAWLRAQGVATEEDDWQSG